MMMNQRKPDALDIAVGQRIRIERLARHMSQTELAERIGVSFQQVQKYENGANRVGSGRLYQIAAVLGIHVSTLFKGGERAEKTNDSGLLDLLAEPQSVRLMRAFAKITDTTVRRSLVQLAEKFAESP